MARLIGYHGVPTVMHKSYQVLEDFEQGLWVSPWQVWSGAAVGQLDGSTARDGAQSLTGGVGGHTRSDVDTRVTGRRLSVWFRVDTIFDAVGLGFFSGTDRCYSASSAGYAASFWMRLAGRPFDYRQYSGSASIGLTGGVWYLLEVETTGTTTATMRIYDSNCRLVAGLPIYGSGMEPFGPGVCLLTTGSAHLDTLVFH